MTLGQANMLTVIGYLVQGAVVRANRYLLGAGTAALYPRHHNFGGGRVCFAGEGLS